MLRLPTVIGITLLPLVAHAEIGLMRLATGFDEPLWAEAPLGSSDSLWVVEKSGTVRILNLESGTRSLFLDIRDKIKIRMNEQGLLGLSFSKDFLSTGRFYLYYTDLKGDTVISRYTAEGKNKKRCDASTEEQLLTISQNARNHNGGWIDIGPDGYLYISTGDGGRSYDPNDHGQDLTTHLGKILRIDVSGKTGYSIPPDNPFLNNLKAKPEIYAYGLRNPWRCSWDRKTGDFYIADVGQNQFEEVNFTPAGTGSGANYGWRLREGLIKTPKKNTGGPTPHQSTDPIYTYEHSGGDFSGVSITGGYVYRGPIESLQGKYFFADYANPRVWSLEVKGATATNIQDWTDRLQPNEGNLNRIASFGEDHEGGLLIISHGGDIFKIIEK